MPITFRSESQPSVEMIEKNAKELLGILGKNSNETRGVFAVDQLGAAIKTLQALITARAAIRKSHALAEIDEKAGQRFKVDISLRAIPLAELLEKSLKARKPVTWGV